LSNFTQKIEDPKMTRRKLKILKLQSIETKDLQTSQGEKQIPNFSPCETSHKKMKNPQNDKKTIENSGISKYENKKPSNTRKKAHTPFSCL